MRAHRVATVLLAALMAACAVPPPPKPAPVQASESPDRITASDESESSKRARVRLELAAAYFGRGQMETALDQVKLALLAEPNLGQAHNLRGLIYASLGDERLAEESFRRALQINPRDTDTMQNFGWYLCQQKRYPEANQQFDQLMAVPQYRDGARTLLTQGVCHAYAGNLPQAERTLLRSLEMDPANPATAVNLSEVLYRKGDLERARGFILRVNQQADVASAQTLWLAARIEHRLGNQQSLDDVGRQLRNRFPASREASLFDRGQFNE
ncbi:MAG: pilus assembly protein PilW [Methylibium sp. NZG]|nr:MAG: pilus assembly protein PilW [Methylibium sp. NZG]